MVELMELYVELTPNVWVGYIIGTSSVSPQAKEPWQLNHVCDQNIPKLQVFDGFRMF